MITCSARNFIMYFKPCVKYGNIIFGINSIFGEFNYESNGSFGNENGVRTRKLRPKWRKREIWPFGQKGQVFWATMTRDKAIVALSQGNVAGHARMTCDIAILAMSRA